MNQKPNIFREQSLERLSSPERLDQLMQVVAPRDWLFLVALGSLVAGAVSWSIWGRIPVTVEGRGVLLYPYRTSELQSPAAGQLASLRLKPGDLIQRGEVIGTIERVDLRQELQQQTLKLRRLQQQQQQLSTATNQQTTAEIQTLRQKQQTLRQALRDKQLLINPLRSSEQLTLQKQRQALAQSLRDKQAIAPILQQQLENRQKLRNEGAIPTDLLLQSAQAYQENRQQISTIQTQLQDLNRQALIIEQTYRSTQSQMNDLQAQIQELQNQEETLTQRKLEVDIQRSNQIQEVKQQIAQLTLQLRQSSQIMSQYSGRILELHAKPGQVLHQGDRLGLVEVELPSAQLVSMAYFPIKDGKRIQPGMPLQITPDSVQRERYGGILGTVQSVSTFPVSRQTVVSAVGHVEVADSLMFPGGQMEILAELKPDSGTFTGYRWSSSRGPKMTLTPGTTASIRATIDQQAPIMFVLPILKSFSNLS